MDVLLKFGQTSFGKSALRQMGVAPPPSLRRAQFGWQSRIARDGIAVVGGSTGPVTDALASVLARSGFRVGWVGEDDHAAPFEAPARVWAEPLVRLGEVNAAPLSDEQLASRGFADSCAALVYDGSQAYTTKALDDVYRFFHTHLRRLAKNGRVVILSRPSACARGTEARVVQKGLEGFTRSLAKELGRKGSTANLMRVAVGAEPVLAGPLRFFLSRFSAFVTGQVLDVDPSVAREVGPSTQEASTPLLSLSEEPFRPRPLVGKRAIVTGAAGGIGEQTALSLAREGAHVVVLDRPAESARAGRVASRVGGEVLLCDLSDPSAAATVAQRTEALGGVDLVVHNAGVTRDKTLARMKQEAWDLVMEVNLRAILRVNEQLLSRSLLRENGRVVLLSSVGGIAGNVGQTNYATTKAALIELAREMSEGLAARGATCNAIAPGFIETRMTARMPVGVREAARRLSSLNQGGRPKDVAEAITFLCTPAASGIQGRVLRVCGGALIGA